MRWIIIVKDFIKKNKFNICIMLIYSIITLIAVMFHEDWRDEAQSWLIARDLNFIDIFKQMKYEGHPCLWHLILLPFAKLGFPYITENIISWLIMNITAVLLLKKCPFDKFIKALILFSAPFIYFYPVISRSYCLIPLALVFIAITYKNRKEKPIQYVLSITLLAHTHILMLGLVGALYLFFFFDELILKFRKKTKEQKRKIIISLLIAIIGLILLFIQLFNSIKTNAYVEEYFTTDNKLGLLFTIFYTITSKIIGNLNDVLIVLIFSTSIPIIIYQLVIHKKTAVMMIIALIYQIFVYLFIYCDLGYQKSLTSLLIIIFFAWIQKYDSKDETKKKFNLFFEIYLSFILMFSCLLGINSIIQEIKQNYSYARQTAEFIDNSIPNNAIFVASSISHASAIIPYTNNNMQFWSPQINEYFTFVTWNEESKQSYSLDEFKLRIDEHFADKNNIYFIYCYNWKEEGLKYFIDNTNAIEIFKSGINPIQKDEKYIVYKLYIK